MWFADTEYMLTPIYARDQLPLGVDMRSPCIIEQMDTTTVGLSQQLAQGFLDLGLPVCGGTPRPHLAHIVTIGELGSSHYGTEDERFNQLYAFLNEHDVRLSIRRGVLRFSLHVYNTPKDVEWVLELTQRWLRG